MKKTYHNPTFSMDTDTFNKLQMLSKQSGMSQSLIVRRLIIQAAKKWEQAKVQNPLLTD